MSGGNLIEAATVHRPMRIGVTCYPTFGGSGIIATELGMALARRGHQVHFISSQLPWRLNAFEENIFFHEVESREYPLFEQSQYVLALASKMVEVAEWHRLDLFHVHYAIPHSTAGVLARQILGARAPALISTLHGTDITLVGSDPSFLPITRFSIEQSTAVTVPSNFLREATYRQLGVAATLPIEVIANFVDTETYRPSGEPRPLRVITILIFARSSEWTKWSRCLAKFTRRLRRLVRAWSWCSSAMVQSARALSD